MLSGIALRTLVALPTSLAGVVDHSDHRASAMATLRSQVSDHPPSRTAPMRVGRLSAARLGSCARAIAAGVLVIVPARGAGFLFPRGAEPRPVATTDTTQLV